MHIDLRNCAGIQDRLPPQISVREILQCPPDPLHIRLGTHHNNYGKLGSFVQFFYIHHIEPAVCYAIEHDHADLRVVPGRSHHLCDHIGCVQPVPRDL